MPVATPLSGSLRALRRALSVLTLAALAAWAAPAAAQPSFAVDAVTAQGEAPGDLRADVYTAVPYADLQFLSRGSGFRASYAVRIDVHRADARGRAGALVRTHAREHDATVRSYAATQRGDLHARALHRLDLEPGRYALRIRVEDGASRRVATREVPLTVRAHTGAVSMSDPLLLDRYDAARRRITPNVENVIPNDQDDFTVFYEVYARRSSTVRAEVQVMPADGRARARAAFSNTQTLRLSEGRNPTTLTMNPAQFRPGEYSLRIRLRTPQGAQLAEVTRPFAIRASGLDRQIADLDQAIDQLRHVARESDLAFIRAGGSPGERMRRFEAFWSQRDPTPGTPRNERMEAYYQRVASANERYGGRSGWATDRGQVYVRYGQPDRVEPGRTGGRTTEVWTYERLGQRFVFVDRSGRGQFELLNDD